jgi:hypothetical protein
MIDIAGMLWLADLGLIAAAAVVEVCAVTFFWPRRRGQPRARQRPSTRVGVAESRSVSAWPDLMGRLMERRQ